jgi:hypothetical protein
MSTKAPEPNGRSSLGATNGPGSRRRVRNRLGPLARVLLIAGVLVFLLISALLARFLSVENAERDTEYALLQAQARGDASAMVARLAGCGENRACVSTQEANAGRLRRPGAVKILSIKSGTAYSLAGATGKTRLAWTVLGRLPVVQCVGVRRTGNFLTGVEVTLLSLSAPIPNEADC